MGLHKPMLVPAIIYGVYVGTWLSQVDFGGAELEVSPYLGIQRRFGPDVQLNSVLSGYIYESAVFGRNANYSEVTVSAEWPDLVTGRLSAAYDSYGSGHSSATGELTGRHPLSDVLEITGGAGFGKMAKVTGYGVTFWNIGLRYFWGARGTCRIQNRSSTEFHRCSNFGHFTDSEKNTERYRIDFPLFGRQCVLARRCELGLK